MTDKQKPTDRDEALRLAKLAGFDPPPAGEVLADLWVCTETQIAELIRLACQVIERPRVLTSAIDAEIAKGGK